jgi:hypothetical protein
MSASKLSVQLGLGYDWRISTEKVRQFAVRGGFIMRAGFLSPLLR